MFKYIIKVIVLNYIPIKIKNSFYIQNHMFMVIEPKESIIYAI